MFHIISWCSARKVIHARSTIPWSGSTSNPAAFGGQPTRVSSTSRDSSPSDVPSQSERVAAHCCSQVSKCSRLPYRSRSVAPAGSTDGQVALASGEDSGTGFAAATSGSATVTTRTQGWSRSQQRVAWYLSLKCTGRPE